MALDTTPDFLAVVPEKGDLNQYWYSKGTVAALADEIRAQAPESVAFLSTPSIYWAFSKAERRNFRVLDLDEDFSADPGWVKYDFKAPDALPSALHHSFDMVVIDPPFITEEVWTLYAAAAKLLLREGGMVIATTVQENEPLLSRLLNTKRARFLPSIPHLVYQYAVFVAGFEPKVLCLSNPEIPED
jgi:16S rRNA G966 N2-methylase RsmD